MPKLFEQLLVSDGRRIVGNNAGAPFYLVQVERVVGLADLLKELVYRLTHLL